MSGFKTFIAKYHHFDCACIQEVQIQHFRFGLMLGPVYIAIIMVYHMIPFHGIILNTVFPLIITPGA